MKVFLLVTVFILAVSATPIDEWNRYKVEYNKVYTSQEENDRRLEQYLKNKEMVEEHNREYERGETTYTIGINQFADWFPEEIDAFLSSKTGPFKGVGKKFQLTPDTAIPDSINWVKKGAVTSVKSQGRCVSGYAFAVAGSMEALLFRSNNSLIDLSAQELVDCIANFGCSGGEAAESFLFLDADGGMFSEKDYPYTGVEQDCKDVGKRSAFCNGFVYLVTETDLKAAVGTVGPVTINFAAGKKFLMYTGGIYKGPCGNELNHVMLVVGYGTDKKSKQPYWLVKNSWGKNWGEKGYARLQKGTGVCGLDIFPIYPIYNQ